MLVEAFRECEGFSTHWTTVEFLSPVNVQIIFSSEWYDMPFQATQLRERFGTFWTPVRFLSCVNPHMPGKVPRCWERFFTRRTTVRFLSSMNFQVGFQDTWLAEWLGTFWTPEEFPSSVSLHMPGEVLCCNARCITHWTNTRFLFCVNFYMGFQSI